MSSQALAVRCGAILDAVRVRRPRVHCLMNTVVQRLVADGLTVLGCIPAMTGSVEEVAHFIGGADALLINLGTLDADRRQAIRIGTGAAQARNLPWVLDPVHCDASPPRLAFAQSLIAARPSVVRGNRHEMAGLAVDEAITAVTTGEVDWIGHGARRIGIGNGHAWLSMTTGTGCLSGALIAAFLAVEADPAIAAATALLAMGVAAELAAEKSAGPGTFAVTLLDALHELDGGTLTEKARIADVQG